MTSTWQDSEARFLDGLRTRYEADGFTFTAHPERGDLPDFLGGYMPDALARRPGQNIVIEVKGRSGLADPRLQEIRRLFDGRPDWRFHLAVMGADPSASMEIARVAPAAVRGAVEDADALLAQGHRRAAFVLAWSLLEAALRARSRDNPGAALSPGAVVQSLAMNGLIEADRERSLRNLIGLRNRIVHGDVEADPAPDAVDLVLRSVDHVLEADAV
ncbi:HepT-like ribonuclease domain-containing protein [Methylobacterium oryzisoli]|uniref:HepT-like ribonuclease domain-containing protein n=1 Tax=Methylobacterium oryzisoli TaxID=3385502 RepID=UPI003891AEC6